MSYNSFVMLPAAAGITLERVEHSLNNYLQGKPGTVVAKTRQPWGESVVVSLYGWKTFINISSGKDVNEEAKEIAEHAGANASQKAFLSGSMTRLEISTDDDDMMEHFNDHLLLLQHFETTEKALLFDCNAGQLI